MLLFWAVSIPTNPLNLLSYIDKIGKLYPYGVSVASIVTPQEEQRLDDLSPVCVLCVVSSGQRDSVQDEETLLEAICAKGLRLSRGEYQIERFEREELTQQSIERRMQALNPGVGIVFGGLASAGTVTTYNGSRVLHTHALKKIAGDVLAKKEFWKQLQESILPIIEDR